MDFHVPWMNHPSNFSSLYAPCGSLWNTRYDPSQLGYNFPCYASITTCLKTKFPSCISLGLTLKLYLLDALFLAANSQIWVISLTYLIKSVTHLNPESFTS